MSKRIYTSPSLYLFISRTSILRGFLLNNSMVVYRHRRNDNLEIFYIGIGKEAKRAYSTKDRNKYWHNIVNKCGYTVEIIANPKTWEEACDLEMLLISEYGRKDLGTGNLVNMTDGGEGSLGLVHTDETKAKIGKVHRGKNLSDETRSKISTASSNKSKETRAKISEANTGKKRSEETRAKMSIAQSNRSVERRAKMSAANMGSKNPSAKITEQQVYEIKYCNFNSTHKEIAFIYGIGTSTVSNIRANRTWKHI